MLQILPHFFEDIAPDDEIPNDVVIAAAENNECGEALMKVLLDRRGADIQITDKVVLAAASN